MSPLTLIERRLQKPRRVTTYTSGTGTFTPLEVGGLARVTVVGGGGGSTGSWSATNPYWGGYPNIAYYTHGAGGGGGGEFRALVRLLASSYPYAVGAGGTAGAGGEYNSGGWGGNSNLGPWAAGGGQGGVAGYAYDEFVDPEWARIFVPNYGGNGGSSVYFDTGRPAGENGVCGGRFVLSGGGGAWSTTNWADHEASAANKAGYVAGAPLWNTPTAGFQERNPDGNTYGAGGGSSRYGKGGSGSTSATAGSAGTAGSGYGGGGGGTTAKNSGTIQNWAGTAGSGGIIIIEEF